MPDCDIPLLCAVLAGWRACMRTGGGHGLVLGGRVQVGAVATLAPTRDSSCMVAA
jgi:hypothetical protein